MVKSLTILLSKINGKQVSVSAKLYDLLIFYGSTGHLLGSCSKDDTMDCMKQVRIAVKEGKMD